MFNANQITEYKDGNTPATGTLVQGSIFEAEFNRIYENFLHISKSALYVSTQADFNSIITRVAANQYKIADGITSLMLGKLSGGFLMSGALSGGDIWGYLETNECVSLEFKSGAYINFEDERGYIEVNTDDCLLKNVDLRGDGSSAAIVQSFLLNAHRVTFDNCKCLNRLSSVDMVGFHGSATALHNMTSKYINCSVYTLRGADKIYGFSECYNLLNCLVYDIDNSPGSDVLYGFWTCSNLSNCIAFQLDQDNSEAKGFYECNNLSSCYAYDIEGGEASGFEQCEVLSACRAQDITANASFSTGAGFRGCDQISACYVYNIDSIGASGDASGFQSCDQISACYAQEIDSAQNNAYGFQGCEEIVACRANDVDAPSGTAHGFYNCTHGAALNSLEAVNGSNDWIDTVDTQVTNKVSCPSVFT